MGHTTGHPPSLPTEEEVGAYLRAHPDFLARHAELVHHLILPPPERGGGNVVDLQSFMLGRLRDEVRALKEQHRALIGTARANMNSQNRIHNAVLVLLDAPSFPRFVQTVTTDLAVILGVDVASLVIETNGLAPPSGSGVIPAAPGTVARLLGRRDVMLLSDTPGTPDIFGPGAGLVRSQALIRVQVTPETPPGLLAFGARDPVLFHESQATELVSFLARVVERCLRAWLDLPDDD